MRIYVYIYIYKYIVEIHYSQMLSLIRRIIHYVMKNKKEHEQFQCSALQRSIKVNRRHINTALKILVEGDGIYMHKWKT